MFILWEKLPEPPEINLLEFEKSITPLPVDNELIALFSGISSIIEDKNKEIVALKIEITDLKRKAHQKPFFDEYTQAIKESGIYDDFGTECIKGV